MPIDFASSPLPIAEPPGFVAPGSFASGLPQQGMPWDGWGETHTHRRFMICSMGKPMSGMRNGGEEGEEDENMDEDEWTHDNQDAQEALEQETDWYIEVDSKLNYLNDRLKGILGWSQEVDRKFLQQDRALEDLAEKIKRLSLQKSVFNQVTQQHRHVQRVI